MLTQENVRAPQFGTSVRGYDRAQVDDYIHQLLEWMEEYAGRTRLAEQVAAEARADAGQLRTRLAEIERRGLTSTPESFKALGDRVGKVLETALEAADELRSGVERDMRAFVAEREEYARAVVAEAEARQETLTDAARRAVHAVLAAGEGERRSVIADIARLGEVRRSVVEEIGHLRAQLADAVDDSPPRVVLERVPELPSGDEIEKTVPRLAARTRAVEPSTLVTIGDRRGDARRGPEDLQGTPSDDDGGQDAAEPEQSSTRVSGGSWR